MVPGPITALVVVALVASTWILTRRTQDLESRLAAIIDGIEVAGLLDAAQRLIARGLEPVMRRFIGYLPGQSNAFEVSFVGASEAGDLAVLQCSVASDVPFLQLVESATQPGDEVIVLGYPLGIRALMARAGSEFVREIQRGGDTDFWTVAGRLAERGLIAPIATRGIGGQRTAQFVTYDAETTSGGSGGPVVGIDGRVVAVNAAILPEFGGSNLGIPAELASDLLADHQNR